MASVALVFGGTGGLGTAIAKRLLNSGYKVALTSRLPESGEKCAQKLAKLVINERPLGDANAAAHRLGHVGLPSVIGLECHVGVEQSVEKCFADVQNLWGTPSIVVNAAGIIYDQLLIKVDTQTTKLVLETNLLGAIFVSKMAAKSMIRKRLPGSIINIGSVVATSGNVGQTVYGTSKAGLIGLTRSLAKELGSRNIRVNLVSPGYVETRMTEGIEGDRVSTVPLGRFGRPEEVAEVVRFLVDATYVTGQVIPVDGGLHLG